MNGRHTTVLFSFACIGVLAVLFVIVNALVKASARENEKEKPGLSYYLAKNVVDHVEYIKDGRTGLCFAYTTDPRYLDDPVISNFEVVPCEVIPSDLLQIYQPVELGPK